jgi:hypothetical protein
MMESLKATAGLSVCRSVCLSPYLAGVNGEGPAYKAHEGMTFDADHRHGGAHQAIG